MTKFAHFPLIESGVAFTDPWYKEDVWCQYRKAFFDTNWLMKLDAHTSDGIVDVKMTFGNSIVADRVKTKKIEDGFTYSYPAHYDVKSVELGIDTACIFFGSLKDLEIFGESAAFHTGGDGLCGDLFVFTVKGQDQPAGFLLSCSFDEDFVTENDIFRQMTSSFGGNEISQEQFMSAVDPNALRNKVLLSGELRIANQAAQRGKPGGEKNPPAPER